MDRRGFTRLLMGSAALGTGLVFAQQTTAFGYNWPRTMRRGMSGGDILELQIRIAGWAADSAPSGTSGVSFALDGKFGPGTEATLKRFQRGYGLAVDGVAGPATQGKLNSFERSNGTSNFAYTEFDCNGHHDFNGGKVSASTARENVRRVMYKLEGVRTRLGNRPINLNSGFRCVSRNNQAGGSSNSKHMYGRAVDISGSGHSINAMMNELKKGGFVYVYTENGYVHGQVD